MDRRNPQHLQPADVALPTADGGEATFVALLVDDDADCRLLMRDAIDATGVRCEVREAESGTAAVEMLASGALAPSLIYLDLEMPGMDGIQTLESIRAIPALSAVPVVMMTGFSSAREMRRAAEAGANSFTLKPAYAERFLDTVVASTRYWLTIHQYPERRLAQSDCRR